MSEFQKMPLEEQARVLQGFLTSPVWQDLIKRALLVEINKRTVELVQSRDPVKDVDTKAEIRAYSWLLNWEKEYKHVLGKLRFMAEMSQGEPPPHGTPYHP
jgi:hypothetical protein